MRDIKRQIVLDTPVPGVELHLLEMGDPSRPTLLLLHGSGGASSLGELPSLLAENSHVLAPSHPGFDGTGRPEGLAEIGQLADLYIDFIKRYGGSDVTVIGFSLGGWIAMEMAIRDRERIGKLILVDPIGVQTSEADITNVLALTAEDALRANYHDSAPFLAAASTATADQRAANAANLAAASGYSSKGLFDPELPQRLTVVTIPTLVLFGESERIVPLASGRAIIHAVNGPAELKVIAGAGHRPQLERPADVEHAINSFIASEPTSIGQP